jgi:formylglycine-generating enzyme required for sulfatase activity/serine/threonine protein kinase
MRHPIRRFAVAAWKVWLQCLGEAVCARGLRALVGAIPFADAVLDVAGDAVQRLRGRQHEEELRGSLQELAPAPPAAAKAEAEAVAAVAAAGQPPEVRERLASYLAQVPAAARQSLKRADDPTGTTVPPSLSLAQAIDLVPLIPARLPRFRPGDRPASIGDWELVELLGAGGFGEVWKARHVDFPATLAAFKFCLDPDAQQRLLQHEGRMINQVLAAGRHPGIVALLDAQLRGNPPWLKYEYVDGGDLTTVVQHVRGPQATEVIRLLAGIVGHFHRLSPPVVHRDLKPSNILVQWLPGRRFALRVADFGIGAVAAQQALNEAARPASSGSIPATVLRGAHTPLYASPQQKRGAPPDVRDDVFALGVMWYQLVSGDLSLERPGGRWRKRLGELGVPAEHLDLLEACCDDSPDERPRDAGVLAEALALAQPAAVPPADRPTPPPPTTPASSRLPVVESPPTFEQHLRNLAAQQRYGEAVQLIEQQPRQQRDLALLVRLREEWRTSALRRAAEAAGQHDYAAAAAALAELPPVLRDEEQLERYRTAQRRLDALADEILEILPTHNTVLLRLKVDDYLRLKPNDPRMRALRETLPEIADAIVNSLGMRLVLIRPGRFLMGSADGEPNRGNDEGPQHEVEITRPYYLGICQVTQREFEAVTGKNPSFFHPRNGGSPEHPVEQVTWDEAADFCRRLSALPAERGAGRLYRLPTEAEWEYACRAGTTTPFWWGSSATATQANFDGNNPYGGAPKGVYLQRTTKVGSYPGSPWGLFDLHGNVWEWTADWADPGYYARGERKDPPGPAQGTARVLRGGSWGAYGYSCRCSSRKWIEPGSRLNYVGFRVACVLGTRVG